MKLGPLRQLLVDYGIKLIESDLGIGATGNLSVFDRGEGLMAITPSAMDYRDCAAADIVLINLDGDVVDGDRRPSSEWEMHLGCYRARTDIDAVVHTHSVAATTLGVLGRELPAVHYMLALSGAATIPLAPYHPFGSSELAQAAVAAMGESRACLLQNHGVLAVGADLHQAFDLAQQVEFCAEIYLRAVAVAEPHILSDEQMRQVMEQLGSYQRQQ